MSNILPMTIEAMVAILLLFTILYCVRLNAQLKRLKADEQAMKAVIGELLGSIEKAERAIQGLKTTVREADATLGGHLQDAERFCIEIKTSTEAGAEVLSRISAIAGARPWLMGVEPEEHKRGPDAPDPRTIVAAAKALAERAKARAKAAA